MIGTPVRAPRGSQISCKGRSQEAALRMLTNNLDPGVAERWLGYGERDRAGLVFNDLVRRGEVAAPIVIGRDHLDAGSVASPYRETEARATVRTRSRIGRS